MINEWLIDSLNKRGIRVNDDKSLDICFFGKRTQRVSDVETAIRQQQHIIDQQKNEQLENEEIGKLMRTFHEKVVSMSRMTVEELTLIKLISYKNYLFEILLLMSRKKENLRKDGYERLKKVYEMVEKKNLPAANLASQAALDRMRRRWLVNAKVIDRSITRLEALRQLQKNIKK